MSKRFPEKGYGRKEIQESPELQAKIINYLIDVHSKCEKDPNYWIYLVERLQHDLGINYVTAKYLTDKGVLQKTLIRDKYPRKVRFSKDRAIPNPLMLNQLLSLDKKIECVEIEVKQESDLDFIKRFKDASIIKKAKDMGFSIKISKPIEFII